MVSIVNFEQVNADWVIPLPSVLVQQQSLVQKPGRHVLVQSQQ